MGGSRPATLAQYGGDGGCGLASTITQVCEAEPQRDDAQGCVRVISALIAPLLVGRMRRGPIKFRADPVLLVKVVEVPVPGALPDPGLPASGRETVGSFHPANVAVFQQGKDSSPGVGERQSKLLAPPHLLAGVHGLTNSARRRAPAANGTADPCVRVVEGRRDLDQVEDSVLDSCARREHSRVLGPLDRVRPVDDKARDLRSCRTFRRRNRNRDQRAGLVDQPVPLGGRLMTENRVRSGSEQGGPENRLPSGYTGKRYVYTPLRSLPPAVAHLAAHRTRVHAGLDALTAGDGSALDGQ